MLSLALADGKKKLTEQGLRCFINKHRQHKLQGSLNNYTTKDKLVCLFTYTVCQQKLNKGRKRSEGDKESPLTPSKCVGTNTNSLIQMLLCNLHD
jgi:hypothetical protein